MEFLRLYVMILALVVPSVFAGIPSYFKIKSPNPQTPWIVGQTNPVTWVSANEGVTQFDMELARLKTDGLLFVARNISTSWNALNIMLDSVPAGDDYYVLFLDSIHGNMYSMSDRFSILAAGNTPPAGSVATPVPTVSTVTLKGGPNPTAQFVMTFAGTSGGISTRLLGMQTGWMGRGVIVSAGVVGAVLGGVLAMW
ncbi:hypothetical protein RhiJN_27369 [Ceratobasidium sp. AG-Ba]|nr:hypothetical protein RhiJN_13287 [Ceratobasidium sp. AG-Ba]QRV99350.1 hypothetical protein RhiJN_27369 [Ceratobasidium sp. AG-Ba]QRW13855.1 hypothetical protein RhiLY_12854 [Ceratobasidium sp. AG-Ba]